MPASRPRICAEGTRNKGITKVTLSERKRSGAGRAIGSLTGFIVSVESREILPEESLRVGKGAAGLRSRCWDTRRCIGTDERVNATTTDSEERNRDTKEPGAGNLLARICGGRRGGNSPALPGHFKYFIRLELRNYQRKYFISRLITTFLE